MAKAARANIASRNFYKTPDRQGVLYGPEFEPIAIEMREVRNMTFGQMAAELGAQHKNAAFRLYNRAIRNRGRQGESPAEKPPTKAELGIKIVADMIQEAESQRGFTDTLRLRFSELSDAGKGARVSSKEGIALAQAVVAASKGVFSGLSTLARTAGVEAPRKVDIALEARRNAEFQDQLASNLSLALTLVLERYHGPNEALRICGEVLRKLAELDVSTGIRSELEHTRLIEVDGEPMPSSDTNASDNHGD